MRRGSILAVVLVIVALVSMVAAGLLFRVHAGMAASAAVGDGEQAFEAAMSGLRLAMAVLDKSAGDIDLWYDNPSLFKNQFVCDDGTSRWYFTVYAANPADPKQPN